MSLTRPAAVLALVAACVGLGPAARATESLKSLRPTPTPTATPTPTPTATPTAIASPIREDYGFDVSVDYVNYPRAYAAAPDYVECRVNSGKDFYGDALSQALQTPSPAMTGQPIVTYTAPTNVLVRKASTNTVPMYASSLTYVCTLFATGLKGPVYFPAAGVVGPQSRLYVTGTFNPNAAHIPVQPHLVLNGTGATPLPVTPTPTPTPTPSPTLN